MSNDKLSNKSYLTRQYIMFQERKRIMTDESFKAANLRGVSDGISNGEVDAFRHAYASAKVTRDKGASFSSVMGKLNEIDNEKKEALTHFFSKNKSYRHLVKRYQDVKPITNHLHMDEYNNHIGRQIGKQARKEGWSDDRIADEVKRALDEGKLIDNVEDEEANKERYQQRYEESPDFSVSFPGNNAAKQALENGLGLIRKMRRYQR